VFIPPPRRGEVTRLIFRPVYGQYGEEEEEEEEEEGL